MDLRDKIGKYTSYHWCLSAEIPLWGQSGCRRAGSMRRREIGDGYPPCTPCNPGRELGFRMGRNRTATAQGHANWGSQR